MKTLPVLVILVAVAATARAGSTDRAIIAAMQLSEVPNYSWTSSVVDDAHTYEIKGRTEAGGYTWQRLPMIKTIARRLGRDAGTDFEIIFNGSERFAINTEEGWRTLDELPRRHRDWIEQNDSWYVAVPAPHVVHAGIVEINQPDPWESPVVYVPLRRELDAYSNVQLALHLPHEELAVVVSSFTSLEVEGGIATGTLSELGAQLLLVRDGQQHIEPMAAAGAFKLWFSNGSVTKYLLELAGVLYVNRREILVQQKSDTVLTHVGTTSVQLTDDLRLKLEQ